MKAHQICCHDSPIASLWVNWIHLPICFHLHFIRFTYWNNLLSCRQPTEIRWSTEGTHLTSQSNCRAIAQEKQQNEPKRLPQRFVATLTKFKRFTTVYVFFLKQMKHKDAYVICYCSFTINVLSTSLILISRDHKKKRYWYPDGMWL